MTILIWRNRCSRSTFARLSTERPFPDGRPSPGPANALVLSGEDTAHDPIVAAAQAPGCPDRFVQPRLAASGDEDVGALGDESPGGGQADAAVAPVMTATFPSSFFDMGLLRCP